MRVKHLRSAASTECWLCQSAVQQEWHHPLSGLRVLLCPTCGHRTASHGTNEASVEDYHLAYDQHTFLSSLATTRERQAREIVAALRANGMSQGLFDYGCGRAFLVKEALRVGFRGVGGGDSSPLALRCLRDLGVTALPLPTDGSLVPLSEKELGFTPKVVAFLDVIEHFEGDLLSMLRCWLHELPASVEAVVLKVPVSDGVLFRIASSLARLGVDGPLRQLHQVGTSPPHYQYFCRTSVRLLVRSLGMDVVQAWDDLEFEPGSLHERVAMLRTVPRPLSGALGRALATVATNLGRADSHVIIASRR